MVHQEVIRSEVSPDLVFVLFINVQSLMAHVHVNNETPNMVSNDIKYIIARPHLMKTTTMSVSQRIGSRPVHDHNASDIIRNGGVDATQ